MWLLAAVFLSGGLLLILFLIRNKSDFPTGTGWNLGDIMQLAGIVLTVLALAVALSALQITLAASRQTQEAINRQQAELDSSKKAIDTIIEAVQTQNKVIESNVVVSKAQLELIQRQAQLDQQRVSRRPFVDLYYEDRSVDDLASPVTIGRSGDSVKIRFVVKNNGEATAQKGTIVVIGDPSTLVVDQEGKSTSERSRRHRLQVGMRDLLTYTPTQDELPLDLNLHGAIPDEFSLSFSIFGENFEAIRRKINFRLTP
jgi:hypothetical protein